MKLWFWRIVRGLLWVFIAAHIYLLALRFLPVPGTVLMIQRAIVGETIKRDWTRLEDISPHLVSAVIAAEDARFCEHEGIDLKAIQTAIKDNADGGRRRGGSTISQQTAKNVFLWNGGGFARKGAEAWFTPVSDFVWGKKRTMEIYLNVAEWGDGIFGVESAAQERFGKSASDLTKWEAALLAAVLPSPNKWRLDPPSDYVSGRARTINARLQVVRNEGYANCVLGLPPKRKTPRKPVSKPELKPEPELDVAAPPKPPEEEIPEPPMSIEVDELDSAIVEMGEPDPNEEEEIIAPESEDSETPSVTIKPPENDEPNPG